MITKTELSSHAVTSIMISEAVILTLNGIATVIMIVASVIMIKSAAIIIVATAQCPAIL